MDSEIADVPQTVSNASTRWTIRKSLRGLAVKLVPRSLIREVRRYRQFKKSERIIYIKLRAAHQFGFLSRKIPSSARSFVFVCFGNIMRSPMAAALFRQAIAIRPELITNISSTGLNATPGKPAHPWAISAAQEFGISLAEHQALLLTRRMVDEADAILAMDFQNQVELLSRFPHAAGKFFMLGTYLNSGTSSIEIRDPFFGDLDETRRCYRLLQTCVQNLATSLCASENLHSKGAR